IGNDTIYTLPTLSINNQKKVNVSQLLNKKDTVNKNFEKQIDFKMLPEKERKYVYINYLYYETGKSDIEKKYLQTLNGILQLLLLNDNLGVEIHGYSDIIGEEEANMELSKIRAFNVMEFIVSKQIESRRITMTAHGETGTEKSEKEMQQYRKVEIKVFEVKNN
ncbi:MAG: hypothetical protein COZ21_03540, partial [Bacteroidetes bacterium CG_4_10_14_3_um_filter_31_20]